MRGIYRICVALLLSIFTGAVESMADTCSDALRDTLPASWELDEVCVQPVPDRDAWWGAFRDPVLTNLISRAVSNNFDVLAAEQRMESARQMICETRAGYFPTIGVAAGWSREKTSGEIQSSKGHAPYMSYFNLGLTMNWEIDVFGKIRTRLKADKANFSATEAEYAATLVSLCSNLAQAYFTLRLAQAEKQIADANIAVAEKLLKLAQTRYDVGLVSGVDPVQARIVVAKTRSSLPAIEASIATAINQISVLTGEYPDKLAYLLTPASLPEPPALPCTATPSDLLRRRPDIVAAEKELAYYAAQVGISKQDFLPTLSLQASIGTEAHNLKDLFSSGSMTCTLMPTLSWNIFEGMARPARVAQAKAAMMAQIDSYNLTVMTAVQEVNNALTQWKEQADMAIYDGMILKEARRELELQMDRYRQGLCSFADVGNAQNTVYQYELSVAQSRAGVLEALVSVYTALGGGWM